MPTREDVAEAYDALADEYDTVAEAAPHNAHHEFPGTTAVIPEVEGKRVLDAGCGAGRYAAWLADEGADVVACDVSREMVERTRERIDEATVHRADLGEPLSFAADDAFDGVVCAGALGYLADWETPLAEFARVLRPGGFLVVSVGHPFSPVNREAASDYFAVERREPEFEVGVPIYRRPLEQIVRPVTDAGFQLAELGEPQPTEAFREVAPEEYEEAATEPTYLCLRAVRA